jgi:hypothetical protein
MTRKTQIKVLIVIIGFTLASCHVLYVPNSFNSPLLRNKGDGQVNVAFGTSGYEVQTAYAITNHIGVMANWHLLYSKSYDTIKEQRSLAELGFGYTERHSDNGMFEIFAGAGLGSVPADFKYSSYNGTQTTQLTRIFIQPSLGFYNDWLDMSIISRLAAVTIGRETNWFYEPGFMAKIGYKRFRFYSCMGFSIPLNKATERSWNNNPVIFSVGIHFNFGKRLLE